MQKTLLSFRAMLPFLTLAVLVGCGGGGGVGPISTTAPDVTYIFPNANPAITPAGTAFTITQVKFTFTGFPNQPAGQLYEFLKIDTTFSQDISNALPFPGTLISSGSQLGLLTTIDTDANLGTGNIGTACDFSSVKGAEFFVDPGLTPGRLADGNYAVNAGTTTESGPVEEAVTTVKGTVLTQTLALSPLGSFSTVPRIAVALNALNGLELTVNRESPPYGGCAPASGEYSLGQ